MDTSTLTQQVESVERNITFLQKEHHILLTGLRLEIRHLKKRCNDLSCELSKRPPRRSAEELVLEEELLQAHVADAERRLAQQECCQMELRAEVRHAAGRAGALQVRLRDEERNFLEELKRRSHKITALSRDLRKQTDVAAQLTFQLHSTRFRLYHQAEQERDGDEDEERDNTQGPACSSPSPQVSPVGAEARRGARCPARSRRSERARECVPQERVLGPEEPRAMPDPALFLYPFTNRLLPLRTSLAGHWREAGPSERSRGRTARIRTRSTREDAGPETTEL